MIAFFSTVQHSTTHYNYTQQCVVVIEKNWEALISGDVLQELIRKFKLTNK